MLAEKIRKEFPKLKQSRWITNEEAQVLLDLIEDQGFGLVYESGTANGFSARLMAETGAEVHTYDPVDRPQVWSRNIHSTLNISCYREEFENVRSVLEEREDKALFFIDGEHSYGGCSRDWLAVEPFLRKGDVVVFHDYQDRGVVKTRMRHIDGKPYTQKEVKTDRSMLIVTV